MGRAFQLLDEHGSACVGEPTIDRLLYLGVTHQSAPLAIRELLHTDQDLGPQFAAACGDRGLSSLLVLSTCDRFEIYIFSSVKPLNDWLAITARVFGLSPACLAPYVSMSTGACAARHLLRVAAGMESRIIGEPHILCQLRRAFQKAKKIGTVGATLSALCRSAIHTGKRVRKETDINRHRQSIVSLTIQDLQRTLRPRTIARKKTIKQGPTWLPVIPAQAGIQFRSRYRSENPSEIEVLSCAGPALRPWSRKRIAIVGTGTLAAGFVAAMKDETTHLVVVSDRYDRARALAKSAGASAWTRGEWLAQLSTVDAVVMCTNCSSYVLSREVLASIASRGLSIWDLSSPRSVEPSAGRLDGVRLTHLDDLVQDLPDLQNGLSACEAIVQQELSRFIDWSIHRRVAPKISHLIKIMHHRARQDGRVIDTRRLHHQIMRLKKEAAA